MFIISLIQEPKKALVDISIAFRLYLVYIWSILFGFVCYRLHILKLFVKGSKYPSSFELSMINLGLR